MKLVMPGRHQFCLSLGMAVCLLAASRGSATTIAVPVGGAQANIGGCVLASLSGIMFFNTPCATAHVYDAGSPDTGGYSGLTGGTVQDLLGTAVTGTLASPVVGFATFVTSSGTVIFDLRSIDPGSGTLAGCSSNAIGSACTPVGSPLTLTQVAAGKVSIALSLNGIAYLGSSATGSNLTGALFTSQNLIPGTITGVLAQAFSAAGIQNSYSATFSSVAVPTVPEPGTPVMLLAGLGMLALSLVRRKNRFNS